MSFYDELTLKFWQPAKINFSIQESLLVAYQIENGKSKNKWLTTNSSDTSAKAAAKFFAIFANATLQDFGFGMDTTRAIDTGAVVLTSAERSEHNRTPDVNRFAVNAI